MSLHVEQQASRSSANGWDWSVWLEGEPTELDDVVSATYILHPSFPDPVKERTDRSTGFRLDASGWGEFRIRVKVRLRSGSELALEHDLQLDSPQGRAPRKERAIFVTSAASDRATVRSLQRSLTSENITVQTTADDAATGASWVEQCATTLMGVDALVAVISNRANPWLEQEIRIADRLGIPVVPITLGNAELPIDLRDRQALTVDKHADPSSYATRLAMSIKALKP